VQTQKLPQTTPTPDQPVTRQQLFSSGTITYVAMGASDAVGVGTNQPETEGYVPKIAGRLPAGSHLINLGISGIHLHQALDRELPLALSAQPKLITIWLVANDFVAGVTYDNYMKDLDSLLKQLREGTQARIIMANLPDLTRLPSFARLTADQKARALTEIKRWNVTIASTAVHYQVTIVDLFSEGSQLTAHPEYISGDGFHPSSTGYTQLAGFFWTAIHG
jgi:lysophospholipase L1-like esterase